MRTSLSLAVAAFAAAVLAHPHPDSEAVNITMPLFPLDLFMKAGPAAGTVIQKCTRAGVLALAFDDGPYTYTQELVDILNKGNAKGTFFVTGTLYGLYHQLTLFDP